MTSAFVLLSRHPLAEFKANQLVKSRAPSASPVAAKSPANALLRQLQSDLSPKYTQASRPSPDSRCSRYGRHQKPAEQIDCLDNEILNAVLRKSMSDSGSPPVRRSMTPSPARTPKSRKQPTSVPKVMVSDPMTASPMANLISSASPSPPDYVSPIEKLLMRNRLDQCTASDYDGSGISSNKLGSPSDEPSPNARSTVGDARPVPSLEQLSRKSLIFDVDAAATAVPPPITVRKPLVVVPRVASSGRSPVVAKIVAGGTIKPQQQHVSPRRNKLLPLAPLFCETTAPQAPKPPMPAVELAPATIEADEAESEMSDVEAKITTFRVQRTPNESDEGGNGRVEETDDTDTEDTSPSIPTLSVLKNSSQCTYLKVGLDVSLPPQPMAPALPSPSTNDATLLPIPSPSRSDATLLCMPLDVLASDPLSASLSLMLGTNEQRETEDISEHCQDLISTHKLDTSYESDTADDMPAIEQPAATPIAEPADATAAPPMDPSDRSASVDSGVDSGKGSSVGAGDELTVDWHVGQLVWARIGNYPYWPSITCASPDGQLFNHMQRLDKIQTKIHIRFLADNGRRCWVFTKDVVLFQGKEDFERMRAEMPANVSVADNETECPPICPPFLSSESDCILAQMKLTVLRARGFVINPTQMLFWQQAVVEADMLRTFAVDRRLGVFERTLESERYGVLSPIGKMQY